MLALCVTSVNKLSNLISLFLYDNQLTGIIPNFNALHDLQHLSLFDNKLNGTIPNFSKLVNLKRLFIFNNKLTGSMPDFSLLINLTHFYVYNNQLTGSIPNFSKLPLEILDIRNNVVCKKSNIDYNNWYIEPTFEDKISWQEQLNEFPDCFSPNQPPTADFTFSPQRGLAPLTVNLDASSSSDSDGLIVSYEWEVDINLNFICEKSPCIPIPALFSKVGEKASINLEESGEYEIKLTVTDDKGATNTKFSTITVEKKLKSEFCTSSIIGVNINTTNRNCNNGNCTFSGVKINCDNDICQLCNANNKCKKILYDGDTKVSGGSTKCQDGECKLSIKINTGNSTANTTTKSSINLSNNFSCNGDKTNQPPIADYSTSSSSGQAPLSIDLNAEYSSDPDGSIVSYIWSVNGQTFAGKTVTITLATAGYHPITLTVTDDQGATADKTYKFLVRPVNPEPPIADFTIYPKSDDSSYQAPLKITLDGGDSFAFDGSIVSYQWDIAIPCKISPCLDSTLMTFTDRVPSTTLEAGKYSIILTVTDDKGMTNTKSVEITVEPKIDFCTSSIQDVNFSTTGAVCINSNCDNPLGIKVICNNDICQWCDINNDCGKILYNDFTKITGGFITCDNGQCKVKVKVGDGSLSSNFTCIGKPIVTNQSPIADFTVSPVRGQAPLEITLDASSSSDSDGVIVSYEWEIDINLNVICTISPCIPIPTLFSKVGERTSITLEEAGEYKIKLIVTDDKGATNEKTYTITVNPSSSVPLTNNYKLINTLSTKGRVLSIAFSPDDSYLFSGGGNFNDKVWEMKLWDVATGKEIRAFPANFSVRGVAYSPDGQYVLSGDSDKKVKLWDVNTGQLVRTFEGHTGRGGIHAVTFSTDGQYILSSGWMDSTLKLWGVNSGQEIRTFHQTTSSVSDVAISFDGQYALSGTTGSDYKMKLWDVNTGQLIRSFEEHTWLVSAVAFSPNGRYALSGSWDDTLKLWDVNSGQLIRTFQGHTREIGAVAFFSNGNYFVSGSWDGSIKLWDISKENEIQTLKGNIGEINSVAISSDGRYIASGGRDGIELWEIDGNISENQPPITDFIVSSVRGQAPLKITLDAHTRFAYDPDGSIVSYEWSIDGQNLTGKTVSITLENVATYPIILTVTDDKGATSQKKRYVKVLSPATTPIIRIEPTTLNFDNAQDLEQRLRSGRDLEIEIHKVPSNKELFMEIDMPIDENPTDPIISRLRNVEINLDALSQLDTT